MIIKGKVLTNNGYVDIGDLKVGDMILNDLHRIHEVKDIKKVSVTGYFTFKLNPNLCISVDTKVKTLLGKIVPQEGNSLLMFQPNMRSIIDYVIPVSANVTAYDVILDGTNNSCYVSDYCVVLGDSI